MGLCEVGEDGGLDVVEGLVDAETVGGEGREDGGTDEVCGYGDGVGGDGGAVLFNEVAEKVESMVEFLVVVHESLRHEVRHTIFGGAAPPSALQIPVNRTLSTAIH